GRLSHVIGLPEVGRYVDEAQVEADGVDSVQPDEPKDRPPLAAKRFANGRGRSAVLRLQVVVRETPTDPVSKDPDDASNKKGHPPAPAHPRGASERCRDHRPPRRSQEEAGVGTERCEAPEESATFNG